MRPFLSLLLLLALVAAAETTVRFSPKGGCTAAIIAEINAATNAIMMQAYNFTSPSIGDALAAAARRGVQVVELQDNIASHQKNFQGPKLIAAGGAVFIDKAHKISHNKIILIDSQTILTGSFNFSENAENSNAENLVILRHEPALAVSYVRNFSNHLTHCLPFKPAPPLASPKAQNK